VDALRASKLTEKTNQDFNTVFTLAFIQHLSITLPSLAYNIIPVTHFLVSLVLYYT
jgi:hypothetical protein